MRKIFLLFTFAALFAVPGKQRGIEVFTKIPMVDMKSLELKRCSRLGGIEKGMDPWIKRRVAQKNREKDLYESEGYVITMVRKNLSKGKFMHALRLGFFDGIAKISALVIDGKKVCRGYIMPKMEWESFKTAQSSDGSLVFLDARRQQKVYRNFFERVASRTKATGFATPFFTPECVGIDQDDKKLYLLDLETVYECRVMNDAQCANLPSDYVRVIRGR
ncbi:MAG: hypothetical protein P0S94_05300 [Simkaniaceae bacterium]|nr:hypothetical protein [Simkaniaceae bacterium]